jgi:hypothetical protein
MNNPKPMTQQATSSMVLRRSQRGQLLWGTAEVWVAGAKDSV